MATGKRAFEGREAGQHHGDDLRARSAADVGIEPMTPPALDRVVKMSRQGTGEEVAGGQRCVRRVEMDRRGRLDRRRRSRGDCRPAKERARLAWGLGLLTVVILAAIAARPILDALPAELAPLRFSIGPPDRGNFGPSPSFLALSPDGRMLALSDRMRPVSRNCGFDPWTCRRPPVARDRECRANHSGRPIAVM